MSYLLYDELVNTQRDGIFINAGKNIFIVGNVISTPTLPCIAKFSSTGVADTDFNGSGYISGITAETEYIYDMKFREDGSIYLCGKTNSTDSVIWKYE